MTNALLLIQIERGNQLARGYDREHDDEHVDGSLAQAAACYAAPLPIFVRSVALTGDPASGGQNPPASVNLYKRAWPWAGAIKTSPPVSVGERIQELAKAGALIMAEIERLQRLAALTDASTAPPRLALY